MTVVFGTAGHIDHGKTALLRALTGIDADRLPEERRRGMTIDVGYAHLALDDGTEIDFVDVPGHDRLVGNMLVGAGEIDAALLVVAVDDGPRAQTIEHLELLDALDIRNGLAVVTKCDLVPAGDPRRAEVAGQVAGLLARTSLAGAPVLVASSSTGEGIDAVREALVAIRDRVRASAGHGVSGMRRVPTRLAVDRVFAVRGRGSVVTGTLRGQEVHVGDSLRVEPVGAGLRVREIQVHGHPVERVDGGGRVALNVAGVDPSLLRRGVVLTSGPGVVATSRLLVAIRPPADLDGAGGPALRGPTWPPAHDAALRFHTGTDRLTARVRRAAREAVSLETGEEVVRLVLERPVAVARGDRFVLRRSSPGATAAGGRILDALPPLGVSRRRATAGRLTALARATAPDEIAGALVALHGALPRDAVVAMAAATDAPHADPAGVRRFGRWLLAGDVADDLEGAAVAAVRERHLADPLAGGLPLAELRPILARSLRRAATIAGADASLVAAAVVDGLVADGLLARSGDVLRDPARGPELPLPVLAAMDRLEATLAVAAPPPLPDAMRAAGCPQEGLRALEASGRIVRIDPTLAYAASTYRRLEALALSMAADGPLAPAAFRDATGTSRRYSLAILEDLDGRGLLTRTPDGHLPGPRAPRG